VGDVDGDASSDLVVGAMDNDAGARDAGAAYLVTGGLSGDTNLSAVAAKLVGEDAADEAGEYLSPAGDIDGDGIEDLLVGACGVSDTGSAAGATYLVLLPISGTVDLSNADAKLLGVTSDDEACHPGRAGDLDGDGADDVLVGSPGGRGAARSSGVAIVLFGEPSGTVNLRDADVNLQGASTSDEAGISVAGALDVNADGAEDVIVGANGVSEGTGTAEGAAYVVLGPLTAGSVALSDADWILGGATVASNAGISVAGVGDADADGYGDFAVGAYGDTTAGSWAGAAYLVPGAIGW
jgi:hypothetical protein